MASRSFCRLSSSTTNFLYLDNSSHINSELYVGTFNMLEWSTVMAMCCWRQKAKVQWMKCAWWGQQQQDCMATVCHTLFHLLLCWLMHDIKPNTRDSGAGLTCVCFSESINLSCYILILHTPLTSSRSQPSHIPYTSKSCSSSPSALTDSPPCFRG